MGSVREILDVPGFSDSSVPSSFLLTRQAQALEDSPRGATNGGTSASDPADDPLAMGDLRLMQEPGPPIRQGHVVYCAYHLYNAARGGLRGGGARGCRWVCSGARTGSVPTR